MIISLHWLHFYVAYYTHSPFALTIATNPALNWKSQIKFNTNSLCAIFTKLLFIWLARILSSSVFLSFVSTVSEPFSTSHSDCLSLSFWNNSLVCFPPPPKKITYFVARYLYSPDFYFCHIFRHLSFYFIFFLISSFLPVGIIFSLAFIYFRSFFLIPPFNYPLSFLYISTGSFFSFFS